MNPRLDPSDLAELLAGLQVPLSIGVPLGTAKEPLLRIRKSLQLWGWPNAKEIADQLEKVEWIKGT